MAGPPGVVLVPVGRDDQRELRMNLEEEDDDTHAVLPLLPAPPPASYFVFLSATLMNFSVMRSLSPMATYFSRSLAPSSSDGGSVHTPSA